MLMLIGLPDLQNVSENL